MDEIKDSLSAQAGLLCELLTLAIQPDLDEAGVTLGGFELLTAVQACGGKATQVEIARRLGITPPSLSESVKLAAKRNLIEQHVDSSDARRKILRLTSAGRKAMLAILRGVNNAEARMVDEIAAAQIATALDVLKKANRNLARSVQGNTDVTALARKQGRASKRAT